MCVVVGLRLRLYGLGFAVFCQHDTLAFGCGACVVGVKNGSGGPINLRGPKHPEPPIDSLPRDQFDIFFTDVPTMFSE